MITESGHLLSSGSTSAPDRPNTNTDFHGQIRKWDLDGNLIWEIEMDWPLDSTKDSIQGYNSVKKIGNDRYIAVGGGLISGFGLVPAATIFNGDGEILMTRHYTSILDTANEAGFYEVLVMEDGSFIAGGPYDDNQRGGQGHQDAFILKLDENGCEYEACQPPLAVEEILDAGEVEFAAYPNPFDDGITVITPTDYGTIYVYNIQGQLLREQDVKSASTELITTNLSTGIYLAVFLSDMGEKSTLKIIKQ